jgi:hypothetical protein
MCRVRGLVLSTHNLQISNRANHLEIIFNERVEENEASRARSRII